MVESMAKLDKEMWERAGFQNFPRYEYVPLPKEVYSILKRKYKDYVLLSYYYTDKHGDKISFLEYISCDEDFKMANRGPGYCSHDVSADVWVLLAKEIALDNIHLQTKSFRERNINNIK